MKKIRKRKLLFWLYIFYAISHEYVLYVIGFIFANISMYVPFYIVGNMLPFSIFEIFVFVSYTATYELYLKKDIPEYFELKPHLRELIKYLKAR